MSAAVLTKLPKDILDYDFLFEDWLEAGDRITEWDASIEDSEAELQRGDYTDKSVRLWIMGGKDGETAKIDLTVQTFGGRTKTACLKLRIRECH